MTNNNPLTLKDEIVQTIKDMGPMPIGSYMHTCLCDYDHGYYMVEHPFGTEGDFITAPEVSQMFGEVIGLMLLDFWMKNPTEEPINLVELGPGQGTLMADILRVLSKNPKLKSLITVHFVEISDLLEEEQAKKVPVDDWGTTWYEYLGKLPEGKVWFIANEFFDALPISQFIKKENDWGERRISIDDNDNLIFVEDGWPERTMSLGDDTYYTFAKDGPGPGFTLMDESLKNSAKINDVVEICVGALCAMTDIAEHIQTSGGLAIIIDYGYGTYSVGDTLQSVKNHKFTSILDQPGKQDLTAHVNFASLEQVAEEAGLKTLGPVYQGDYLLALGIAERAEALIKSNQKIPREKILQDLNRLTGVDEMGELFKVLVVVDEASPIPAPFKVGEP
jgi:NADH dehydrogenase [ubiquinone] 1 alpha subcomplex assembly factor 7